MYRNKILGSSLLLIFAVFTGHVWAKDIQDSNRPSIEVVNNGIGGNNSRDILNRLPAILKAGPDTIILMVGTNDCLNSNKSLACEEYISNLKLIVNLVKAQKIKLVLLTIPPCYGEYVLTRHPAEFFGNQTPQSKVKSFNSALTSFALEQKLPLIDIHSIFSAIGNVGPDADSLIRNTANSKIQDGVHPTAQGYRVIGLAVYDFLKCQGYKPRKIACVGDSITFGAHVKGEGTSAGQTYPAFLSALLNVN